MKAQACYFMREKQTVVLKSELKWEQGIAVVSDGGFSGGSVDFIIDEKGNRLDDVYRFRLIEGPMSYLDTTYPKT